MRSKLRLWVRRYGLAEIAGTTGAFAGFLLVQSWTANRILAAYLAVACENLGFYGVMAFRELMSAVSWEMRQLVVMTGNLMFEFGVAEVIDGLIVRPFSLAGATKLLGDSYGVLIGKLVADVVFYAVTMVFYDLRVRHFDSKNDGG